MGGFGEAVQKQSGATMDDLKASAAKIQTYHKEVNSTQTFPYDEKKIEEFLFSERKKEKGDGYFCCLFYGKDGTGKTGLLQSYPFKGKNDQMLVLDLDGGNGPLLDKEIGYNRERANHFLVRNPMCFSTNEVGEVVCDYATTLNVIKNTLHYVQRYHKEKNIVAFAIDGISSLLRICEFVMRIERSLTVDGGVSPRFWNLRMRLFLDICEQARALTAEGLDVFFIAHQDFIDSDEEGNELQIAGVKKSFGGLVHQKVRCLVSETTEDVTFTAVVDKSHHKLHVKGTRFCFAKVNKTTGEAVWNGNEIYNILRGIKLQK